MRDDYTEADILAFRPPRVSAVVAGWQSWWELGFRHDVSKAEVSAVCAEVLDSGLIVGVEAATTPGGAVWEFCVTSREHPLDIEGYPEVDALLRRLDEALGGVVQVNGWPRHHWRTFREARTAP